MIKYLVTLLLLLSTSAVFAGYNVVNPFVFDTESEPPEEPTIVGLGDIGQCGLASTDTFPLGDFSTAHRYSLTFFISEVDATIYSVTLPLSRPTGTGGTTDVTIRVRFELDDGGDWESKTNLNNGTYWLSEEFYQNTLSTTQENVKFEFEEPVHISAGTGYWVGADPTGYSTTDYVLVGQGFACDTSLENRITLDAAKVRSVLSAITPISFEGVLD